ncbi:hypothetical protein QMO14_27280 [Variovorax sp. CAN2819]|uniref:hypothetical protein n=1 Tax=Variovorax sp. CAN15 TaxID=3046727 RepID=UPI00264738A4|nr:hypothetical protein [Variovorax sp. CAN15]MDN6887285.1 hypothetical protein [Variovorax sp. CAN15]
MGVIAEHLRIAELQRLGASASLLQMAAGQCLHEAFRGSCLGPPWYSYHGARAPEGPTLVPLWDHGSRVCGLRETERGLEFIEFSIEDPSGLERLAGTEQGFWATRVDFLYECDLADEVLRSAAERVGFRFLERYLRSREAAEEQLGSFGAHRAWLRELVAGIDRDAASV